MIKKQSVKKQLVKEILLHLEEQLKAAVSAASMAHSTATHSESAAENKYDTFGLEASYLAEGQSKRVEELIGAKEKISSMPIQHYESPGRIGLGALVELEGDTGVVQRIFLAPAAGGLKIKLEGMLIIVVTPHSPLGKAVMGKEVDDEVIWTKGNDKNSQWVVSVQ